MKKTKKDISKSQKQSNLRILIVAMSIVMIWRGVRGILDKFLFPNNELLSYVVGLLLGIIILYIDDKRIDELSHNG